MNGAQGRAISGESGRRMVEFQRKPLQQLLRVIAHLFDQTQRFAIGADRDVVLAVVQVQTVDFDAARASAELSGGFESR